MIILCSTDNKVVERWQEGLDGHQTVSINNHAELNSSLQSSADALLLLHLNFLEPDVLEQVDQLTQQNPAVRVIACADIPEDEQGLALLKSGVYGYCNTWMVPAMLTRVIELVSAGEVWVGRSLVLRLINNLPTASSGKQDIEDDRLADLSQRELKVAQMVGQGMSNKQIADELHITERTVKAHLSTVFKKTGCSDRIKLALLVVGAAKAGS